MSRAQIAIVGGGFAGVWAAMGAARRLRDFGATRDVAITLLSPGQDLVIRPRLYEADLRGIHVPLAPMLSAVGADHRPAAVVDIDVDRRVLTLRGRAPGTLPFDQLIICAGSQVHLPREVWGDDEVGGIHRVDVYGRALALRRALAARLDGGDASAHVAIVGAGFTGLELAAELADIIKGGAARGSTEGSVSLIESAPSIAPEFGPKARAAIETALGSLGVEMRTGVGVRTLEDAGLTLDDGEWIDCDLTVWTGGPRANQLNEQLGLPLDQSGRVTVNPHLGTTIDGVWAAGDAARAVVDGRRVAPMSCQHAIPQGRQAGENAAAAILGRSPRSYRQPLYLTCLDLGAAGALITSGFERNRILADGAQGKRFKRFVNRSFIYPPRTASSARLLRLGRRAGTGRAAARMQGMALRSDILRGILSSLAEDRADQYCRRDGIDANA